MRETMIKKLLYCFVAGLMLLCVSCGWFEKDQMDYPRTVTFSKEGGEKIIKGGVVSPLCIGKDDDDICSYPEDGYETVRYKWLTARVPLDNYSMIIINAEPNTSGKSRMLRIFAYSGYQYATIEVKQE